MGGWDDVRHLPGPADQGAAPAGAPRATARAEFGWRPGDTVDILVFWAADSRRPPETRAMPLTIACPGCGRRLKAPDALAGRRLPCPACKTEVHVPEPPAEDAAAALLLGDDPPWPSPWRASAT